MSHMAVGIGAAARSDKDTYTAVDFDSLPTNKPGQTDAANATTVTSRKKAASPKYMIVCFRMREAFVFS